MAKGKRGSIRCAVIGYGGAFNMGRGHAQWINAVPGMEVVAACDTDPARAAVAAEDFPGIATFTDVHALLGGCDFDLAVIVTPHNSHAELSIACSKAGKHVVVEKPMCITVEEADAMIAAAKAAGRVLTVFQNRRHDGDFLTLKEIIEKGLIGEVFKVELSQGGYGKPGSWWRSFKETSGGAFYDWGAHMVDWLLHVVPLRIDHVMGYFHKLVWHEVTNEDHVHAVIRFAGGATADVQLSSVQRISKPRWLVLGTKGALVDTHEGKFRVVTDLKGIGAELHIPYRPSNWQAYYDELAAHLLRGRPLAVTPESARRVIAVIRAAEISSQSGKPEPVAHEDEGLYL